MKTKNKIKSRYNSDMGKNISEEEQAMVGRSSSLRYAVLYTGRQECEKILKKGFFIKRHLKKYYNFPTSF